MSSIDNTRLILHTSFHIYNIVRMYNMYYMYGLHVGTNFSTSNLRFSPAEYAEIKFPINNTHTCIIFVRCLVVLFFLRNFGKNSSGMRYFQFTYRNVTLFRDSRCLILYDRICCIPNIDVSIDAEHVPLENIPRIKLDICIYMHI